MLLALDLKNSGFALSYLRYVSGSLLEPQQGAFIERLQALRTNLRTAPRDFECRLVVRGPLTEQLLGGDVGGTDVDDTKLKALIEDLRSQDRDATIVRLSVRSLDPFSAAFAARRMVEESFSVHRLYNVQKQMQLQPKVLTVESNGTGLTIDTTNRGMQGTPKARSIEQHVTKVGRLLERLSIEDRGLFAAALQYYRLTHTAATDEGRAINLWIALEALFQTMDPESIIAKLVAYVPVIQALHYVNDILRAFSKDVLPLWKQCDNPDMLATFDHSSKYYLDPIDVGAAITNGTSSDSFRRLSKLVSVNALLLNRFSRLHDRMFKDPSALLRRISDHENNVRWQLRRIYRLRNRITHQGQVAENSVQLLGHLEQYFLSTVHDLIHTLSIRPGLSIPEAFDSRMHDQEFLRTKLATKTPTPVSAHFVMSGYPNHEGDKTALFWADIVD